MRNRKPLSLTLTFTILVVTVVAVNCTQQEQTLRARAGWPTPSPGDATSSNPTTANPSAAAQASQPYDLQFLDSMISHHQEAVQMAQLAAGKAQHAELKEMAQKMAADQQQEIEQMRTWRQRWFGDRPQATSDQDRSGPLMHATPLAQSSPQADSSPQTHATPGMAGSMQPEMSMLQAATGNDFDRMFLEMMIPHHQTAVQMAQEAQSRAERQEVKQLARKIAGEQQQEIARMNQWLSVWKKPAA